MLGAGYAGLTVAQEVARRSRGRIPITLVDRNPVHVLRTELYEVGRLAEAGDRADRFVVPLATVFDRTPVRLQQGNVQEIDLEQRRVRLDTDVLSFRSLAIALGNVAAYYGVPGAADHTHQVYRLSGAKRLAADLVATERASGTLPGERRPRVVVVGGGSTGTEVATEIATTDWRAVAGPDARPPAVFLVTGSLPFLAGFAPPLIDRARRVLARGGVTIVPGVNVARVEPKLVHLEDGTVFAADILVWCAGLEAPPVVQSLPVVHGRAGRIAVDATLEVAGHPGVFAIGDVAQHTDPATGAPVPATAQAALAEARVASQNLVARWFDRPLVPFRYAERGSVVALGVGQAAGSLRRFPIWGSPAALLKRIVQRDYARAVERGERPSLL